MGIGKSGVHFQKARMQVQRRGIKQPSIFNYLVKIVIYGYYCSIIFVSNKWKGVDPVGRVLMRLILLLVVLSLAVFPVGVMITLTAEHYLTWRRREQVRACSMEAVSRLK